MSAQKVNKSLRQIVSSKRKVLEIQQVILKKKQTDRQNSQTSIFNKMKSLHQDTHKCELSIRKLNLIERCISEDSQYKIINLLKHDRYEELSLSEIYDELYQNFHREVAVNYHYKYISKTG